MSVDEETTEGNSLRGSTLYRGHRAGTTTDDTTEFPNVVPLRKCFGTRIGDDTYFQYLCPLDTSGSLSPVVESGLHLDPTLRRTVPEIRERQPTGPRHSVSTGVIWVSLVEYLSQSGAAARINTEERRETFG